MKKFVARSLAAVLLATASAPAIAAQSWLLPVISPVAPVPNHQNAALALDFVNQVYGENGQSYPWLTSVPGFSYTRSGDSGLNWLTSAQNQRSNLLAYSQGAFATQWATSATANSDNQTTAPDGTNTASQILDTATSAAHNTTTNASANYVNGVNYVYSVYVKAGAQNVVQLALPNGGAFSGAYANYQLTGAGSVTASGGGVTSGITSVGNGWYRCWISATAAASTSTWSGVVSLVNNTTNATRFLVYTGTGTGVYVWGAQLEHGTAPAGYISTAAGSSVTINDPAGVDQVLVDFAPSRTNLLKSSQNFSASWTLTNATVSAGGTAPDGSATAQVLNEGSATGAHAIAQLQSVTSGITATASAYLQAGTRRYVQLSISNGSARVWITVDTQNWTITEAPTNGSATFVADTLTPVGGGWYRASVSGSLTGLTTYYTGLDGATAATGGGVSPSYTGTNATIVGWGLQLEQQVAGLPSTITYPTPYIATAGSAVTASDPRITDLGLLAESSSANIVPQSQTFGTTWASLNGVTVAQSGNAPDGTATAWQLKESASGTGSRTLQDGAMTITSGTTYTASIYAQAGALGFVQITPVSGADYFYATMNLTTCAVTQAAAGGSGTYTSSSGTLLANGWCRLSVTGSLPDTSAQLRVGLANTGTGGFGPSYSGTGTGYVTIWGAQVEAASSPSFYIPTLAASATRGSDLPVVSPYTLGAQGTIAAGFIPLNESTLFGGIVGDSGSSKSPLEYNATNQSATYNGSVKLSGPTTPFTVGAQSKMAATWRANYRAVTANQAAPTSDTNAFGQPLTGIQFGGRSSSGPFLNGFITNAYVWTFPATNIQLPALTQ